jgi:hypothetical protein
MPFTAHTCVEREPIGLGDAFQPGVRPVQWSYSANHEGLAPLLRPDNVSSITRDSMRRTAIVTVENFRRYMAGEALLNVVNIQAGY